MIERQRLIPAVILGAMGLLALKLIGWSSATYPGTVPASPPLFAASAGGSGTTGRAAPSPKTDASILVMDPETTGSIDKPTAKDKIEAEAAARREAERAANPNNKASIINGTAQPVSPAERAVLERLAERRAELEARQRELELREKLLDSAEKKLEARAGDAEGAVGKPGAATGKAAAETPAAVQNLVIMYEAMKPKDAARVFDRLALDVLVPVVQKMNPRKMSEVLAAMAPERAEKLTIALATAGRPFEPGPRADSAALPANELPAIAPPRR